MSEPREQTFRQPCGGLKDLFQRRAGRLRDERAYDQASGDAGDVSGGRVALTAGPVWFTTQTVAANIARMHTRSLSVCEPR
jgi:hypothetical protein